MCIVELSLILALIRAITRLTKKPFWILIKGNFVILATDGRKFTPNSGPIFELLESPPRFKCLVKNVSGEAVTVGPKLNGRSFMFTDALLATKKKDRKFGKAFSFASGNK